MRTDHLQKLLEIVRDDMKRRCEQSFYEEHRDQWGKYHGDISDVIKDIKHGLKMIAEIIMVIAAIGIIVGLYLGITDSNADKKW